MNATDIELEAPAWLTTVSAAQGIAMFKRMDTQDAERAMAQLVREVWANLDRDEGDSGRYRTTWLLDETVIKIPTTGDGWDIRGGACSSLLEVHQYESGGYDDGYGKLHEIVPCRIVWHESGLPIVIMERIEAHWPDGKGCQWRPDWTDIVDNGQVGYNERTRSWQIYDAGCTPDHTGPRWEIIESLAA